MIYGMLPESYLERLLITLVCGTMSYGQSSSSVLGPREPKHTESDLDGEIGPPERKKMNENLDDQQQASKEALFVYFGMLIVEFCLELLDTDAMLLDWDSEVLGGQLRVKASNAYSRIDSDLKKIRKRCSCENTISRGTFQKVLSSKQLLYVYVHNAYMAYSNVMFADVVKLADRVSEVKHFLSPCKEQNCHEVYYPYFHGNDYCRFLCETLELPSTSDAVTQLKKLPSGLEPYSEDDWTYRLHVCFLSKNIASEFRADLRSYNVKRSWEGRLPEGVNKDCLLFQGSPDIIVKMKVDGMIINYGDKNEDDLPSSPESGRLQMGHQMIGIKPYAGSSFQPNKIGELVAALHTSLACRALRKYTEGKTFDSLEANGLFIHRSVGIIHMKVTLSKKDRIMVASNLLVDGVSTPESLCAVIKYFITKL